MPLELVAPVTARRATTALSRAQGRELPVNPGRVGRHDPKSHGMSPNRVAGGVERWLRNFEQGVKWKLGLTAGMFCLRIRSEDEEESPPEPHTGLQGEGGPCCPEKRSNDCTAC